jgi:predicted TIM-barrel fold metal-dependent hydrolase
LGVEEVGAFLPAPALLVESSMADLFTSMEKNEIQASVLIAHPPFLTNEAVMKAAEDYPDQIVPALNLGKSAHRHAKEAVEAFEEAIVKLQGRLLLKIHAAAEGESLSGERYQLLLEKASEYIIPVILHTGCIQAHLIHKSPDLGDPHLFRTWFADFPRVPFILAHMNMHEPAKAFEVGEEFENVYLDTSWQPAEVIGEAVRRIGSDRIFFGSDWPLLGGNQQVAMGRLQEALTAGYIDEAQMKQILGQNFLRMLRSAEAQTRVVLKLRTQEEPHGA